MIRAPISVFAMAVLCALASPAGAGMNVPQPRYEPPGVLVSFQGGLAAQNIFDVLTAVQKTGVRIPTEEIQVKEGDSICRMLVARNYPPECDGLTKFVDSLNPQVQLIRRTLQVGEKFKFPNLQISRYRSINNYPKSVPTQADIGERVSRSYTNMSKSYPNELADYKSRSIEKEGYVSLEYWSYEIYIPVADEATAGRLMDEIYDLGLGNVYVDLFVAMSAPAKLNGRTADEVRDLCADNQTENKVVKSPFTYADLLDRDAGVTDAVKQGLSASPRPVSVTIIDVEISKSPNLWPAFGDEPASKDWTCKWGGFNPNMHHATHLASIIASSEKFGFGGLAPNARLSGFLWWRLKGDKLDKSAPDRALSLVDQFTERSDEFPLPVYLAATEFDRIERGGRPVAQLDRPEQRFQNRLTGNIKSIGPLLVVAAGQRDDPNAPGEALERVSNISPQNLGDLNNVVVVTACEICEDGAQKLMPSANHSRPSEYLVHVAAPGGVPLPGWINADTIGAARGTSQAAAYVAGVASAMIGAFPETYKTPVAVKTRIQATSRPLSLKTDGSNSDADKIATGVVDPQLALLDPKKTWLKDAMGWRSVRLRKNLPEYKFTSMTGARDLIDGDHILRFVKVPGPDPDVSWIVYSDRMKKGLDQIGGSVDRTEIVAPEENAALMLCDGSTIRLNTIEDFIPRMGVGGDACAIGSRL